MAYGLIQSLYRLGSGGALNDLIPFLASVHKCLRPCDLCQELALGTKPAKSRSHTTCLRSGPYAASFWRAQANTRLAQTLRRDLPEIAQVAGAIRLIGADGPRGNLIDGPGENLYDGLARAFARVLVLLQVELVLLLVSARVQPV